MSKVEKMLNDFSNRYLKYNGLVNLKTDITQQEE